MTLPNILVISNYSGSTTAIRPEAEIFVGLLQIGFQITVMTETGSEYATKLESHGAQIIDYRPKSKVDFTAIKLIRQTVRRNTIDIVHGFNSKAMVNSILALMFSKVRIVGYRGYTGNIHWYDPSCYVAYLNPRIDYMICLAESVREMFLANGMPERKAVTINKGHDPSWYEGVEPASLEEFNIPEGALVCSFVANYRTKMKGLHHLVNAVNKLPSDYSLRILLIGSGMDTTEILGLINQGAYPERFIFAGYRKDAINIVKSCDVAISVSLFGEATQKAMLEALFMAKPVIISDIPGNKGMVINGSGGFVVEPGNEKDIEQALMQLYQNRTSLITMGHNAKSHITEFLSADRTRDSYAAFYKSIASPIN
ncbi:MAG: glycosyltransferase [Flavobacteriales bacterium]